MNELGKLLATMNKTAVPKSPMGVALEYTIKRWDILLNYLYDGSLEIDWITTGSKTPSVPMHLVAKTTSLPDRTKELNGQPCSIHFSEPAK
jgi:hypothetical protein